MSTQNQHHPGATTRPGAGEHKKTLEYAGRALLIVIVLLFAGIMYLNSNNTGKNNSTPGIVPLLELENDTPITGDNPEPENNGEETVPSTAEDPETSQPEYPEDPIFVPASECPDGMAFDTENGGCNPITGYEDVKDYWKFMSVPHDCYLEGSNPSAQNAIGYISEQHEIDGKKFYVGEISVKKGKEGYLNFPIVYKDEVGIEQTWLEFKSNSVEEVSFTLRENRVRKQVSYFSYSGCLTTPNDTEYRYCTGKNSGITVIENSPETGGFALEGAFFSSGKEVTSSEVYLMSSYRLVIKHD